MRRHVSDLDYLCDQRPPCWLKGLSAIVLDEKIPECLGMFGAVLVDPDFLCPTVRLHECIEEDLLEVHCALKLLVCGANLGFEAGHVEAQVLACYDLLDEFGETCLGSTS